MKLTRTEERIKSVHVSNSRKIRNKNAIRKPELSWLKRITNKDEKQTRLRCKPEQVRNPWKTVNRNTIMKSQSS